ncbi:MAG: hypothetical protein K2K75_13125 [Muribaculaceae bacterium]|nr:hypothetical protein [Muribaculaceae bacterium]
MRFVYILLFAFLAVALCGCNSDIFIDEPDWEDFNDITIEGDGGEAILVIPTKNLERFEFDLMSESKRYCTYYNAQGDIISSDSPASEITRIVFETKFRKLELCKDDSRLTIRSICQTSQDDSHWIIRLEYTYGARSIEFTVLPGKPLRFVEVAYNDDMVVDDRAKVSSFRDGFTNNGPLPQTVTIRPYLNELASILVEPVGRYSWLNGERVDMPVPMYVNEEWVIMQKNGIRPGDRFTYEGPDRFTKIDIDIPEYSSVNIFTDVVYSGAKVSGCMVFHNEILDLTFSEDIKVTSLYPIRHEIRIEDAK